MRSNPARHWLAVGVTWDRTFLSCWFDCCCGWNINSADQNVWTRTAVLSGPMRLCSNLRVVCGYLCFSGAAHSNVITRDLTAWCGERTPHSWTKKE